MNKKIKEDKNKVDEKKLDELVKALKEKNKEIEERENEIENLKIENIKIQEYFNKSREMLERQAKQQVMQEKKKLMKDFLEILDNFERAVDAMEGDSASSTKEGIKLIHKQIQQFLTRHGVREIELKNKMFDPTLCEVGKTVESTKEPNTILEILRKGYYLGDEVLRTAVVAIAVPKEKDKQKGGK